MLKSGRGERVALQMSLEQNPSSQHTLRVSTYNECICMLPCILIMWNSKLKSTMEQSSILLFLSWICSVLTRLRIQNTDEKGCDYFVNKGILNFKKRFTSFVLRCKTSAWACQLSGCPEFPRRSTSWHTSVSSAKLFFFMLCF